MGKKIWERLKNLKKIFQGKKNHNEKKKEKENLAKLINI